MPDAPGPPGLSTSEPIRFCWVRDRMRISATSYVPPCGSAQLRGTAIEAHSYVMVAATCPTSSRGTSGHGRQPGWVPGTAGALLPVTSGAAESDSSGAITGSVQPAVAMTAAASRPTSRRGRRGTG
jgi:hypothetical protein